MPLLCRVRTVQERKAVQVQADAIGQMVSAVGWQASGVLRVESAQIPHLVEPFHLKKATQAPCQR